MFILAYPSTPSTPSTIIFSYRSQYNYEYGGFFTPDKCEHRTFDSIGKDLEGFKIEQCPVCCFIR